MRFLPANAPVGCRIESKIGLDDLTGGQLIIEPVDIGALVIEASVNDSFEKTRLNTRDVSRSLRNHTAGC